MNRPDDSRRSMLDRPVDTFARDYLPHRDLWPVLDYSGYPELGALETLNVAAELLDRWVISGQGGRSAIRCETGAWTYQDLYERANQIARVLIEDLGIIPGNRVLLRGPNTPMMAALWYGVLKAGAICVTTMPLLRPRELAQIAMKARVSLAFTDARFRADIEQATSLAPILSQIVLFNAEGEPGTLEALMREKPPVFENVPTHADDTAIIAFTSGTTGLPKGTMHFHRDILAICDAFPRHVLKPTADDLFCGSPPLAFTFGLGGILLFPMRIGAATLFLEQATPPNLLKGIRDHRATVVFTAPTAYRAMLGLLGDTDISSLRKCVSAGEALPRATFEAWREVTGIPIIDGIGSTEMLHIFISAAEGDIRPGSTGRVVPGYQARIVDESGQELPVGEIGRLAVRGPTGCRYLDDERQKTYVQNGWNLTGDTYRIDSDGYFWYQARNDDMIVSSGYNISGPEVENALLEHSSVAECGVIGVPDNDRGAIVKAFVVLRTGFEGSDQLVRELQDFVKSEIAPYKYPRQIEFVASLPRTETGKLQRFRLRSGA